VVANELFERWQWLVLKREAERGTYHYIILRTRPMAEHAQILLFFLALWCLVSVLFLEHLVSNTTTLAGVGSASVHLARSRFVHSASEHGACCRLIRN